MEISEETSAPLHEAGRCSSEVETDCWDNVINFESNTFDSGVVDGRSDAIESGEMLENGIQSGFLKGFAYGLELGFMGSVSKSQSHSITMSSNNQSSRRGTRTDNAERSSEEDLAYSIRVAHDDNSTTKNVNKSIENTQEGHADSSHEEHSNLGSTVLPVTNRSLKWCNEVSSRAALVPTKNLNNFDFDKEVRELRGLYKLCGSPVGLFRPLTTDRTDNSIADPTKKSNEW